MQVQIDIGFEQLLNLVKELPAAQWTKIKTEMEKQQLQKRPKSKMESFLLDAPTFTKTQLEEIDKTRKAINQWTKD